MLNDFKTDIPLKLSCEYVDKSDKLSCTLVLFLLIKSLILYIKIDNIGKGIKL